MNTDRNVEVKFVLAAQRESKPMLYIPRYVYTFILLKKINKNNCGLKIVQITKYNNTHVIFLSCSVVYSR
jgi:late competence protein required for DNA uptake (superfamily II DNA/RNA helicase)